MTDQPYNRFAQATEQLDEAISLFLKGHFDSALTLAAAADEILRKALSDSGNNSFEWEYHPSIVTEAEDVAQWMIVRACRNYDLLGLPRTAKMR